LIGLISGVDGNASASICTKINVQITDPTILAAAVWPSKPFLNGRISIDGDIYER